MIVQLRHKTNPFPDLTPEQNYVVIGIEADDLRILNDQGFPSLYPHDLFKVIDAHEPEDWLCVESRGYDGGRDFSGICDKRLGC